MRNEKWFIKNDELKQEFVRNNIENNDYYEQMRAEYDGKNADKQQIINNILYCFDDIFDGYYSIYTIMDSIENYLREHKRKHYTIEQAIDAEDFYIKEM